MTALGALLTLFFCFSVIVLPRRFAALAVLAATLYITQGQTIQLGINFLAIRFVSSAAFLRVLLRGELMKITLSRPDRWFLGFFTTLFVFFAARTGTFDIYQLGITVDAWFVYFVFRSLIVDLDDFNFFIRGAALLLIPFAMLMGYEAISGRNLFGIIMGGVPTSPEMREGSYRCQGSFRHAITAGTVGATFVSLFVSYVFRKPRQKWAYAGIFACIIIVIASHSSGPLLASMTAIIGWGCWYLRQRMTVVRRSIIAILVFLHLAMSKPVWFIFDRLSGILGGDGFHRSNLIDKFFLNWDKWFVSGMPFIDTANWAATQLPWGGVDVTNYYVSVGLVGGIVPLVLFITVLTSSFILVGRTGAYLRSQGNDTLPQQVILWGAGCTLCAHVLNLTAVLYWDQSYVIWFLHLAIVSSLSTHFLAQNSAPSAAGSTGPASTQPFGTPTAEGA